jgi:hypothetical protein
MTVTVPGMEQGLRREGATRRISVVATRRFISLIVALVAMLGSLTLWQSAASAKSAKPAKAAKTMFPATGYFSTANKAGQWFLVTPQGAPFYAAAVDTVATDGSGTDQVTDQCPYCETVANDFPSTSAWATATVSQLRSWGFNSLGQWRRLVCTVVRDECRSGGGDPSSAVGR